MKNKRVTQHIPHRMIKRMYRKAVSVKQLPSKIPNRMCETDRLYRHLTPNK